MIKPEYPGITTIQQGPVFTLQPQDNPARKEVFVAEGGLYHGRGGNFRGDLPLEMDYLQATLMPHGPYMEDTEGGIFGELRERGFTLSVHTLDPWHGPQYQSRELITAQRGEQVVWLRREVNISDDGRFREDVYASQHLLHTRHNPYSYDDLYEYGLSDEEELARDGTITPKPTALYTYGYTVGSASLDLLLGMCAAGRFPQHTLPGIPQDDPHEYPHSVLVTREQAIEDRQREHQGQSVSRAGQDTDEQDADDLPF